MFSFSPTRFRRLAIADRKAAGIRSKAAAGLAVPSLADIAFENTPAMGLTVSPEILADVALLVRLASAARALCAAERGFELPPSNT